MDLGGHGLHRSSSSGLAETRQSTYCILGRVASKKRTVCAERLTLRRSERVGPRRVTSTDDALESP